jgi:serine/threonine protein kinase
LKSPGLISYLVPAPPASTKDWLYKKIYNEEYKDFWLQQSKDCIDGIDFYSQDFIELFTSMIMYDSDSRLKLNEIKEHKWYNGEVATKEEMIETFKSRLNCNEDQLKDRKFEKLQIVRISSNSAESFETSSSKTQESSENSDVPAMKLYSDFFYIEESKPIEKQLEEFAKMKKMMFKEMVVIAEEKGKEIAVDMNIVTDDDAQYVEFTCKSLGAKNEFRKV